MRAMWPHRARKGLRARRCGAGTVVGRSTGSLDRTKMALCPHCNADTIRMHAKAWSSAAEPTKCASCGGLSYIANTHGTSVGRTLAASLPVLTLAALFLTGALWPLALAAAVVIGAFVYEALVFYRTPMLPTTSAGVVEARHWQRVGLAILAILGVVVMIVIWGGRAV